MPYTPDLREVVNPTSTKVPRRHTPGIELRTSCSRAELGPYGFDFEIYRVYICWYRMSIVVQGDPLGAHRGTLMRE
jgi:hypothetical protein